MKVRRRDLAVKPDDGGNLPLHHNFRLDHVIYLPIRELTAPTRKLRKRKDAHVEAIMKSLIAFGIILPILIDAAGEIVSGEGVVEAARRLGYREVPTIRLEHLDGNQIRLLRIGLNKIGSDVEWDKIELAAEFSELLSLDLDLNMEASGFATPEIDNLVYTPTDDGEDPDDQVIEVSAAGIAVARVGDIWTFDLHRLIAGSSLDDEVLARLMAGEKARMVLTDQPYNLEIAGVVSGLGRHTHREFPQASGEMSEAEFTAFLTTSITALAACCTDGALLYMFMDHKHMWEMMSAIRSASLHHFQLGVWVKRSPAMGSYLRSQHELCFIAKKGTAPHLNNVLLGRYGRTRSNVWNAPGVNSFGPGRAEQLSMHPTCKNVSMLSDAIKDCSHRGEIVLDGFMGSGSTLIAAERTGRRCYGVELDTLYVDVILQRWERATGREAVLLDTGETFAEVAARRALEEASIAEAPGIARPEVAPRARMRAAA